MKIEIKITDNSGEVQHYEVDESLLSDENLKSAASRYAESENSAYTNDYYGYLKGAEEIRSIFIMKQPTNLHINNTIQNEEGEQL